MPWNADLDGAALRIAGSDASPLRVRAGPGTACGGRKPMTAEKSENGTSPARPRASDLAGAEAAMRRAAQRARRRAAANGTPIPVFRDGRVVWVMVDGEATS